MGGDRGGQPLEPLVQPINCGMWVGGGWVVGWVGLSAWEGGWVGERLQCTHNARPAQPGRHPQAQDRPRPHLHRALRGLSRSLHHSAGRALDGVEEPAQRLAAAPLVCSAAGPGPKRGCVRITVHAYMQDCCIMCSLLAARMPKAREGRSRTHPLPTHTTTPHTNPAAAARRAAHLRVASPGCCCPRPPPLAAV